MAFLAENKEEFVTCMAAMVLQDSDVEVNSDNIALLIKNSGNSTAPYWPSLFSGLMADGNCEKLIWTGSKGAGGAVVAAGAATEEAAPAAAPKPKEEEVDPMEGGMSMFGGGDGGDY